MRTHVLALAASVAALSTATAPLPASAAGLGSVFSCDGGRGTTGTVLGGLAGALAGSQVSKNERTLGAVVGAGLGAFAGNQLACRMSNSSRSQAQNAFQRTLDTGRTETWYDARTGARGTIELTDNYGARAPYAGDYGTHVSSTDLRWARGVDRAYRLTSAAPTYRAAGRTFVRSAPDPDAPTLFAIERGQPIQAAGMTEDGWIAVEQNGWVRGYVAESSVRPMRGMTYASNRCHTVQQTVTVPGRGTEVQRFNACRDGSGQWQIDPI